MADLDPPQAGSAPRRRLLIVEPQALLQWSLVEYLSRWFDVEVADSAMEANRLLDTRPIDGLVVSDELPLPSLQEVEERARVRNNGHLAIIRTVTDAHSHEWPTSAALLLEKPFNLACLAEMMGAALKA